MISILLVRTSAIGDVIQTLPVLEYLTRKFPQAQIDWVVEKGIAPLLEQIDSPSLRRVLTVDTRKWAQAPFSFQTLKEIRECYQSLRAHRYDYVFDLQGNTKSACVTLGAKAPEKIGFGWNSVREKSNLLATSTRYELPPELPIRHKYLGLVQAHFKDPHEFTPSGIRFRLKSEELFRQETARNDLLRQHRKTWMIAVGSKWINKRLKEETLFSFLQQVHARYSPFFLFIYGSDEEKELAERLQTDFKDDAIALGNLSLPLWQSLMWEVDGVIAVDSAALHLAGTTRTRTFSVFGPTSAQIFKPEGEMHVAFQGSCPYRRTFVKQCPILRSCPTGACIREISAEALFRSFERWVG